MIMVNAVNSVKNPELLKDSTIYVSLEPCSHYGKTPPCSDLIIAKGIKKVVVGTVDPFAEVAGRGIKKLLDAGHEVIVGILDKECQEINKRFFTFHKKKRPYIILKWAESADGLIAPAPITRKKKEPVWITNPYSRQLVHKWRAQEQAILVGTQTALADNPSLTTREWAGPSPTRIVLDRKGTLPRNLQLFNHDAPTLVFTETESKEVANVNFIRVDFGESLIEQILDHLHTKGLQSLIVEGGAKTLQTFIDKGLWDEARIFKGETFLQQGIAAPMLNAPEQDVRFILKDKLTILRCGN